LKYAPWNLAARYVPARPGGDLEVVGGRVVVGVERGLEVLGARADRALVVVLVVEHVPGVAPTGAQNASAARASAAMVTAVGFTGSARGSFSRNTQR